jgi:hypothetical protein
MQRMIGMRVTFHAEFRTQGMDRQLDRFPKRIGILVEMNGDGTGFQDQFPELIDCASAPDDQAATERLKIFRE